MVSEFLNKDVIFYLIFILSVYIGLILKKNIKNKTEIHLLRNALTNHNIYILLPIHVFLTIQLIVPKEGGLLYFSSAFISGTLLFALVASNIFIQMKLIKKNQLWYQDVVYYASFGGGNRGLMILFLITPFLKPFLPDLGLQKNIVIDTFAVVDMGYFLVYWLLLEKAIAPKFYEDSKDDLQADQTKTFQKTAVWILIFAVIVNLLKSKFFPEGHQLCDRLSYDCSSTGIEDSLLLLRSLIGLAMFSLSTIYIVMALRNFAGMGKLFSTIIKEISRAIYLRWAPPVVILIVSLFAIGGVNYLAIMLSVVILSLLPPSSVGIQLIGTKDISDHEKFVIPQVYGIWTTILIVIALAINIFSHFSD